MTPLETFQALPGGVKAWLFWLFVLQLGALAFVRKPGARWVLLALAANIASMVTLQKLYGGGAHMSLPHILFWTPLLGYFLVKFRAVREQGPLYLSWAALLVGSITVSLIIDYSKVLSWWLS